MVDTFKTIKQIEEKRDGLHNLLLKAESINSNESLAVSKELDEVINLYYEDSKVKDSETNCMICSSKMYRKSG